MFNWEIVSTLVHDGGIEWKKSPVARKQIKLNISNNFAKF